MTSTEFNLVLEAIGWSRYELAARLGLHSDRAVRRWSAGQNAIPQPIAFWLHEVASALAGLPPPEDWQAAHVHGEHLDGV